MDIIRKLGPRRKARHDPRQETCSDPTGLKIQSPSTGSNLIETPPAPSFPDGVKILHDCFDASVDICFVHGLTGDRDSTWTADRQSTPWPAILLPPTLDKARIITYGYDAYVVRKSVASSNRLLDHATNLLNDLTTDRAVYNASSRPLVFVAHSMGGLVCKEAILLSRHNPEPHLRHIFESIKGIVFMGTPHKGSWMADWATIPAAAVSLVKSINNPLLDILRTDNQFLESIQVRFLAMVREQRERGRPLEVTCFFEELPLPIGRTVVSKESATLDGYNPITIHADHRNMVRFASAHENGFKRLLGELVRWESQVRPCTSQTEKPTEACLKSLAFSQMDDRSHEIDDAVAGTCQWLFKHESYRSWAACDRGLLWIKGKPGCGKSTLLKYALDNYKEASDLVLSFFFHGRGDELQRTLLSLFRSLLHQVLRQAPGSLSNLVDAFEKKCKEIGGPGEKWHWHSDELWRFFEASLPNLLRTRSVWLFLDALDECGKEDAVKLIRRFESLLKDLPRDLRRFHVCFACRPYPILAPDGFFEIHPQHENKADISTLVDDRLSIFPELASSNIPALITDRASGIFLWARLVTERVLELEREGSGVKKIESAIYSVPPELDNLYHGLLETMGPPSLKLIHWICFAIRPLTIDELRWAMVIDADCPHQSLQAYRSADEHISDNIRMKRLVQTLGCGLVEVTPSDPQVVQFIHQSVKDFFTTKGLLNLDSGSTSPVDAAGRAHFQLSRICMTYLVMEDFCRLPKALTNSEGLKRNRHKRRFMEAQAKGLSAEYPFLTYAATYWATHIRRCPNQVELLTPSLRLCDVQTKSFQTWFKVYWMTANHEDPPNWSSLIVASDFGLDAVVARLLQVGADVAAKDHYRRTALLRAIENGHDVIVQLLLAHGADPADADLCSRYKPLYLAAQRGQRAIVQLLMQHGADIYDYGADFSADTYEDRYPWPHRSAIHIAAFRGHLDIVKDLLNWYDDVEIEGTIRQRPLHSAVHSKTGDVSRVLVEEYGADINAFDRRGRTPLHLAAQGGNEDLVRYFIGRGVDTNAQAPIELLDDSTDENEDFGGTTLHCAVSSETPAINAIQVLIHHSPDLDVQDIYGRTALHRAARAGQDAIVRLLLAAGADAHPKDNEGWTPLFYATLQGCQMVMEILLATGRMGQDSETMHEEVMLLSAAKTGDENAVQQLLDKNVNTEAKAAGGTQAGMTPLSFAALHGRETAAQCLLDNGADVNSKAKYGRTPLSFAAESGCSVIARLLLSRGADMTIEDAYHYTPLNWAAQTHHRDVLELLLSKYASMMIANPKGWTPLNSTASIGQTALVKLLLERGADVAVTDNDGRTPLLAAAGGRWHVDMIELLLEKGADVAVPDNNGWTPLHAAASGGHVNVVMLLLKKGADIAALDNDGWTPLHAAASGGRSWHADTVERLLQRGADVAVPDNDGWTPLHIAASNGHADVARLLLEKGADVAVVSKDGETPLHTAAVNGHTSAVKLLLKKGADVAVLDKDGWTPLHTAAAEGHINVVKLLLENGADAAVLSKDGWTPSHTAAAEGHINVVELLCEKGADVAVPNKDGCTPLHAAAAEGYTNVVKLLLENGAEVAVLDKDGWTPLHTAAAEGHINVVELLCEKGADAVVPNKDGWTPLNTATQNGLVDMVRLLLKNGADASQRNGMFPWTTLALAASLGFGSIVEILLMERAVEPNAIDCVGRPALSHAAGSGHHTVVMTLLATPGVNPDLADCYGSTPLSIAARNGHLQVVKSLLDTGDVDLNSKDCFGRTPLSWSRRTGCAEVSKQLLEYAAQRGLPVEHNDLCVGTRSTFDGATSRFCDVCTLRLREDDNYYKCQICAGGDFDICLECYRHNGCCLIREHDLVLH